MYGQNRGGSFERTFSFDSNFWFSAPSLPVKLQEYHAAIDRSSCIYVGNLSYFTTEAQIYDLFNRAGEVKRVVMGLDKFQKTPCGFCFVE